MLSFRNRLRGWHGSGSCTFLKLWRSFVVSEGAFPGCLKLEGLVRTPPNRYGPSSSPFPINRARRKPININILGGTVSGTNRNLPWDKRDPFQDKPEPVPGTNRPFSVEFHSKLTILSHFSLGQVPVCPWNDSPARAV